MACKYKLTYFDSTGRAEISRLMFALKGEKFEDERIKGEDWPEYKKQTPFGWMPILSINKKQYCDSTGAAKYLAREFGFGGKNNLEMLEIDQVMGIVSDLFTGGVKIYFEKDEAKKAELVKKAYSEGGDILKYVGALQKILKAKKNGTYFVGESLTIADVSVMDVFSTFIDDEKVNFEDYPLVLKNKNMVLANPNIKAYKDKQKKA